MKKQSNYLLTILFVGLYLFICSCGPDKYEEIKKNQSKLEEDIAQLKSDAIKRDADMTIAREKITRDKNTIDSFRTIHKNLVADINSSKKHSKNVDLQLENLREQYEAAIISEAYYEFQTGLLEEENKNLEERLQDTEDKKAILLREITVLKNSLVDYRNQISTIAAETTDDATEYSLRLVISQMESQINSCIDLTKA